MKRVKQLCLDHATPWRKGSHIQRRTGDGHSRRAFDEGGDTLIELLVTITILGLAIVSLMGAYLNVLGSSVRNREYAAIDTVLKNFAEAATYQIQLSSSSNPIFSPCATLSGTANSTSSKVGYYDANNNLISYINYQPPKGYTIQVSAPAQYLYNNSSFQTTGCSVSQYWPQLFTLTASGPKGSTSTLSFVVSDPAKETYQQPTTTTMAAATTSTTDGDTTSTSTSTSTSTTTSSTTTTTEHGHGNGH